MLENPIKLLARLPAPVRLLVAGTFINKMGGFILPYLTIVLRREYHLESPQVAMLLSAYGAGAIVSVSSGGVLTDRIGRRRTLLLSLVGSGLLAIAMGAVSSVQAFVPLLVVFGFLADLYRPASHSILGDLLPSSERALGFAALRMAVNLGFAAGMAVGGLLMDWSWRWLFFGDGLTTLGFAVVIYLFIAETRPAAHPDAATQAPVRPWRDLVLWQLMLASMTSGMIFFSHLTVLPLTIIQNAGYPAIVYGLLMGVNGLIIAVVEMSAVHRLRDHRRLRVAALGIALTGLAFGICGVFQHWSWYLLAVLLWTFGEILSIPMLMAFLADWAPEAARGRYLGMFSATWSIAFMLNPALFLPLHGYLGDAHFWPLMLVVSLPAVLVLLHLDVVADRPECLRGLAQAGPR